MSSVALRSAAGLIGVAAELGCQPDVLWALLGAEPGMLKDPDQMLPAERVYLVWEEIYAQTKDPEIAMRITSVRRTPPSDPFGFLVMTSPNVRDALEFGIRYLHLRATTATYRMTEEAHYVKMTQDRVGTDRVGMRLAIEATIAEFVLRIREQLVEEIRPLKVTFAHPAFGASALHEKVLGGPVIFGAAESAFYFPRHILGQPMRHGDPGLSSYFRQQVEAALAQRTEARSTMTSKVRALLAADLARVASLQQIAKRLAIGERTLRRRLEEEGSSFQELLDQLRADVAQRHLQHPRVSIGEVAYLLGYTEPSTFHRAFKRWTGETPMEFRQRSLASQSPPSATPRATEIPE